VRRDWVCGVARSLAAPHALTADRGLFGWPCSSSSSACSSCAPRRTAKTSRSRR
jgi:hypothetical protein